MLRVLRKLRNDWKRNKFKSTVRVTAHSGGQFSLFTHENGSSAFFPYADFNASDRRQLFILAQGFDSFLAEKYQAEGFEIRPSDTVVECGAFVGGFTIAASQLAQNVVAFEPSSRNRACLEANLAQREIANVTVRPEALGAEEGTARLNLSDSGCDDSLLDPDEGAIGQSELVTVRTLQSVITELAIKPEHVFLKIEAEGFEVEVVKGLGDIQPRLIVVDVTAERDGASPREEIRALLESLGYDDFCDTKRCLFARRKG